MVTVDYVDKGRHHAEIQKINSSNKLKNKTTFEINEHDERTASVRSFSSGDDDTNMTLHDAMNSLQSFRHKKSSTNVRNLRSSYLTD